MGALQQTTARIASHIAGVRNISFSDDSRWRRLSKALSQVEPGGMPIHDSTYASLVRWCGNEKALSTGQRVHAHISASGRDQNTFLANLLVQMYGKCGSMEDAMNVFNKIDPRDIFSWNFMIVAYTQNGHQAEALELYRHMQIEGTKPNKFTFFPLLSASASLRDLAQGKQIHECIVDCGFDWDVAIRTALVNMYGKCGALKEAEAVFNKMHERDMLLWNAMIAAYARNGWGKEAMELFRQMDLEGRKPNRITFLSMLDACATLLSLERGRAIHNFIANSRFEEDIVVRNALMNMYGKCGALKDAQAIFDKMHERNVISWTTMITAYAQNGHGKEALELFRQMESEGVKPNTITFLSTLNACVSLASLEDGRFIHGHIIARGFESNVAVGNALVTLYGKCGVLKDSREVFDRMQERNVISWTAMIGACVENGQCREALKLFQQMDLDGIKPDRITFLATLDACTSLASLANGRAIHEHIVASGLELDVALRTALVRMYGKCGSLKDSCAVFNETHERDVILWSAMISAFVQNGCGKEALDLFRKMDLEGAKPDRITFLNALDACTNLASLENGRMIHKWIVACGFESDVPVLTSLLNMYGKCGVLNDARAIFDEMHGRDVIAWNAMIAAYAQNGHGKQALELFDLMDLEGVKPNRNTFLSILNACSHSGLLDVGWQYFIFMNCVYSIIPSEEHYVCMCDLLGRVGCMDEAEDLIMNLPVQPSTVAWTTLLGACRIHGDFERGAHAAEQIIGLHPTDAAPYVLLTNISAATGREGDGAKGRKVTGVGEETLLRL